MIVSDSSQQYYEPLDRQRDAKGYAKEEHSSVASTPQSTLPNLWGSPSSSTSSSAASQRPNPFGLLGSLGSAAPASASGSSGAAGAAGASTAAGSASASGSAGSAGSAGAMGALGGLGSSGTGGFGSMPLSESAMDASLDLLSEMVNSNPELVSSVGRGRGVRDSCCSGRPSTSSWRRTTR